LKNIKNYYILFYFFFFFYKIHQLESILRDFTSLIITKIRIYKFILAKFTNQKNIFIFYNFYGKNIKEVINKINIFYKMG